MFIKKVNHTYYHQSSQKKIMLRKLDLTTDLALLFTWLHQQHVIPYWQLNKSLPLLYQHFRKGLEDSHQHLLIVSIDNRELGYAEIYYAPHDRLANFCKVLPGDYGLHLLIGPQDAIGKGYSELILCALTDFLFAVQKAKRVLVEPNYRVTQLAILQHKLGYLNLGHIQLPEKKAILYAAEPSEFYRRYP